MTPPSNKGFTLIEVVAALALFGIVLVGVVGVFLTNLRAGTYARRLTAAGELAGDKLEELRDTAIDTVSSGSDPQLLTEARGTTAGIFTRRWTVIAGPTTGTRLVTVFVDWPDTAGHVVLSTVIPVIAK